MKQVVILMLILVAVNQTNAQKLNFTFHDIGDTLNKMGQSGLVTMPGNNGWVRKTNKYNDLKYST